MRAASHHRTDRADLPHATPHRRTSDYPNTEKTSMLLHEELARDRIREMRKQVEGGRTERRHRAARRWHRVAHWASERAAQLDR